MSSHAFVDETKQNGLVMAVALVRQSDLRQSRQILRTLRLPAQSRLHFAKESPRRRREIAAAITRLNPAIAIYGATGVADQRAARTACLRQIVSDLSAGGSRRLTLESDESLVRHDQQVLYAAVRYSGCAETLDYEHVAARAEPLLWIPDAAAWCWTHGATWRSRVLPLVGAVTRF